LFVLTVKIRTELLQKQNLNKIKMKAICLNVRQKKNKFILILLEKLQVKRVLKTERHRRENNTEYSFGWK
jgi:hypothetical protein